MKLGSWPPPESAPLRIGTLRSGAVNSSWTWNLLSLVFIPASLSAHDLRAVSIRDKGMASSPKRPWRALQNGQRGGVALGVRGAGGDRHQQQPEQEGPEGDAIGLGELRVDDRPAASGRR